MPGRPPNSAIDTDITKEAKRETAGETPAIYEKAMTSGIKAKVPTIPASTSRNGFWAHCCLYRAKFM
ncbi:hypothetical protein AA106555_1063 [Neokomagataea thailandica NBRC 106555]|uniref:Uncharacterized protein n=1 Tax=Neokomagataea thailandica NBRC 106555 TaxID=1223520 RepID=A0ABQ0QPX5_9PROT|nr:hypothetical protein AA106555_1063 [Neokomagataea thailandica NBRC 106555]